MVVGIGSVEPTHWRTSFSRCVWFPPTRGGAFNAVSGSQAKLFNCLRAYGARTSFPLSGAAKGDAKGAGKGGSDFFSGKGGVKGETSSKDKHNKRAMTTMIRPTTTITAMIAKTTMTMIMRQERFHQKCWRWPSPGRRRACGLVAGQSAFFGKFAP